MTSALDTFDTLEPYNRNSSSRVRHGNGIRRHVMVIYQCHVGHGPYEGGMTILDDDMMLRDMADTHKQEKG